MIKVGVIGCGKIAQVRHLPEYADHEAVEIAGVFDLCKERRDEIAAKYGAVSYQAYQDLLNNPDIDAVSICTANKTHCEITIDALNAGKHVLCEKPMAVSLDECERMVAAAKENNRFLMIGHNQRLAKTHAKARNLIESGEIGKILTYRTSFGHSGPETWAIDNKNVWFFDKNASAFGALADLGIHKTDLIQFLTGQKVKEVMAYIGTLDKRTPDGKFIGVDDNAILIYKMDGGIVGTLTASWTLYGSEDNSTVLYGTEGVMHIYDNPDYSLVIEKPNGEKVFYRLDQIQTNDNQIKSGVIDLWVDCLLHNKEPEISGEEALTAMKAVFASVESSKAGKMVVID